MRGCLSRAARGHTLSRAHGHLRQAAKSVWSEAGPSSFTGSSRQTLRVATAQLRERDTLEANVSRITRFIAEAADAGAQVVALPEAALTGYGPESVARSSESEVAEAEDTVRAACRRHAVAAIVGTPRGGYNTALVIGSDGSELCRQHKMMLVPTDLPWSRPGSTLHVFSLHGVKCSVIICHDKRYPELVRLPVLAGSRVVFYISAESYHDDLPLPAPREGAPWDEERLARECGVYRAQAQARAVENRVWLVKSNWAADADVPTRGSHGQSSVVDPTGVVCCEAGMYDERLLVHTLDLADATALYAKKSLLPEYALAGMWREAVSRVVVEI